MIVHVHVHVDGFVESLLDHIKSLMRRIVADSMDVAKVLAKRKVRIKIDVDVKFINFLVPYLVCVNRRLVTRLSWWRRWTFCAASCTTTTAWRWRRTRVAWVSWCIGVVRCAKENRRSCRPCWRCWPPTWRTALKVGRSFKVVQQLLSRMVEFKTLGCSVSLTRVHTRAQRRRETPWKAAAQQQLARPLLHPPGGALCVRWKHLGSEEHVCATLHAVAVERVSRNPLEGKNLPLTLSFPL